MQIAFWQTDIFNTSYLKKDCISVIKNGVKQVYEQQEQVITRPSIYV
jgi:hypothetical protein